jgi:hypothetical protein
MTGDPWARLVDQLPYWLGSRLNRTQAALDALMLAMARGWAVDQLAAECGRDMADAQDVNAVVLTRLRHAGRTLPTVAPTRFGRAAQPLPWCGVCDDPRTRWVETPDGKLIRCPRCWTDLRQDGRR